MVLPSALSGKRRWIFAALAVNGLLQTALAFAMALVVARVFDGYSKSALLASLTGLWPPALALVAVAVATAWLRRRETIDAERLGQDYVLEVRRKLVMHLSQLTARPQRQQAKGSVFLRFVGDLTALKQWLSYGLAKLCVAGVVIPGILLVLASMSLLLAATVVAILALAGFIVRRLGPAMDSVVRASRRKRSHLAANISEKINHMAVVQVHAAGKRERSRLFRQSQELASAMVARARVAGSLRGLAQLTATLASAGVLLIGAVEVQRGGMSPGSVVAAMSIVGLLVTPIRDLGRVSEFWHAGQVASEKLRAALEAGPAIRNHPQARRLRPGMGRIEFVDVAVEPLFAGVSLVAAAGQRVLLQGDNGSGKSTLLALVPRLADPDCGRIRIDGRNVARTTLGSLRRAIGVVSPDLPLLRGSLRWNLLYRMPGATDDELRSIMEWCGVDRLLRDLPHGLDTRITESAGALSVGQRRRVMLGRALLGSPRILLLDEADANVDAETLAIFERVLSQFPGTILFTSQRPELMNKADVIWRFASGKVLVNPAAERRVGGSGPLSLVKTESQD